MDCLVYLDTHSHKTEEKKTHQWDIRHISIFREKLVI